MPTLHARTIARAALIVGGVPTLADRLRVTPEGIQLWISGKTDPPSRVFLEAIDIVLEYQITQIDHPDDDDLRQHQRPDKS